MKYRCLVLFGAMALVVALPVIASAQEATLSGTVTDTTGGALPGVTVRAVHDASGNSFEAVTDERGAYRLPVRVGAYRLTADLAGFAPVARTLILLAGQQAVANLQMGVSGVQESVTVTGEAPLLDVTQSSLGGNVDPRQMAELPVQGRNFIDLVMLAPGSRINAANNSPSDAVGPSGSSSRQGGDFEINVDGQQINQFTTGAGGDQKGPPKLGRDAIAEFELLSGRFDATQGRSTGMQVNVVTKSGTNTPSGGFAGYFRDDRFNAADFVAKRVLPYQDQQLSGTFGGPILRDKLHVFANYEYEREPLTFVYTTPYPHFNVDRHDLHTEKKAGVRLDAQFSPRTRLAVRGSGWWVDLPLGRGGSATSTPSSETSATVGATQLLATLTQVLSNQVVNEVKVGYAGYETNNYMLLKNPGAVFGFGGPQVVFSGFSAGGANLYPDLLGQDLYSVRDDFTYSFTKGGRHTMKLGAEYLHFNIYDLRCINCEGTLNVSGVPIPANIESLFPNLFDVSTWNLAPLSPISRAWTQGFVSSYALSFPRNTSAFWVQDDWTLSPRLTLNLGLRYDLELNAFADRADYCITTSKCGMQKVELGPFLPSNPDDTNNVGPRVGFSFSADDRTVIRGGYGLYFGTVAVPGRKVYFAQTLSLQTLNDGRPDFATNPWNGPKPTYEEILTKLCTPAALEPGCLRREAPTAGAVYGPDFVMPYAHQVSLGLQRQLGTTMAIEADYAYSGTRDFPGDQPHNISYDPATGANYRFTDISKRPFPDWGFVSMTINGSRSNSHALQTGLTKRFSGGWQASGTYTLSVLRDARPRPVQWNGSRFEPVPFETAPDFGGEYGLAASDQRHRAVFNGVWQLRYGFQLSGLYFFGSGQRFFTNWGGDFRNIGTASARPGERRLRPDGTIVPRNNLVGDPIHRVDLRLLRRFPLGGRAGIDGFLEVFNLFNHANYGSYTTLESSRAYGQPSPNNNVAYTPRALQLGFRFAF